MDIRIISAAFLLGILSADSLGLINILLFTCSAIPVLCVKALLTKKVHLLLLVTVIFFALGAILYKNAYLGEFTDTGKYLGKETVIEGYICDIPYEKYGMMKYTLNVTEINREKVNEKIILSAEEVYEFGESVLLVGKLKPLRGQMNENGYNMRNFYKGKGITARITAEASQPCLIDVNKFSLSYGANMLRNKISKLIDEYRTDDRGAVLKAVLTGNYNFLSEETNKLFTRTALRSLLYPANIHMMLINLFAGVLVSRVRKKPRDMILTAFLVLYTLINTTHPSFIRLLLFTATAILAEHTFKRVYYPGIFSAAVLVTCAVNPLLVFNAGYVMSVASAIVIKAIYVPAINLIKEKRRTALVRLLVARAACVIGTLPLAAYYFNGVSPYSVAASVVILPLVMLIIAVSPIFLALLAMFGEAYAAGWFMHSVTAIILAVPRVVDKLPFSKLFIKTPSLVFIAAYGALVAALAYLIRRKTNYARRFVAAGAGLMLVCAVGFAMKLNTVEVDFVNVGQGDGAVVRSALGANIIIDGGGGTEYSDYNIGENIFLPYLASIGAMNIDAAFVSHYHKDHAEGVAAALENCNVKSLYLPSSLPDSKIRGELERLAAENGTNVYYIERNTTIKFNDGLTVDITVPDSITRESDEENDTSLLINVSYGDFNCLFTGDMTSFAEHNLLRKDKVPTAEVLKIPHHGSRTSADKEFFEHVSPMYSVISAGEDNSFGHPHEQTLETIKNSCIFRTDLNGDIRIISDKKGNIKTHTLK